MKPSKWYRIQFSLRTLLVFTLLVGAAGGIWVGTIAPIRNQWIAAEPIFELGGRVETSPSNIPAWAKRLLPEGQTENIEAVFFNRQPATDEAIEALEKLPHLRRLYAERAQLTPEHIETIAGLKNLERLSVYGNENLLNEDLARLANLKNLEILDMHYCRNADWKALLPFRDNDKIKIVESFVGRSVRIKDPTRLDEFKSVSRFFPDLALVTLNSNLGSDLKKLLEYFPKVVNVRISFDDELDSIYFEQLLKVRRDEPFEVMFIKYRQDDLPSQKLRVQNAIRLAWEQLGPRCDSLEIKTNGTHPDSNTLTFENTKGGTKFKVSIRAGSELKISEAFFENLPMLPNVETLTLNCWINGLIPGIKHVLEKIPNVTDVAANRANDWNRDFWDQLAKYEKVEKLAIFNDTTQAFFVPEVFPEKFMSRKTLTRLHVQLTHWDRELVERMQKACPQLKSFSLNGRQRIEAN